MVNEAKYFQYFLNCVGNLRILWDSAINIVNSFISVHIWFTDN
jgi:hypothetical protein